MTLEFTPNEAQRRAIEFPIDRPLKVIAGAGTGKTAVLTQRFVRIVEKHRIPPSRLLALTFTKKAAAEMRRRISEALVKKKLIAPSEAPLLLWIGNFHSICLRLLKQNALLAGLDPSFDTVDETEQQLILAEIATEFLNKETPGEVDPNRFEDLMIERPGDFVRNISTVFNRLKAQFIEAGDIERTLAAMLDNQYQTIENALRATSANDAIHRNTRRKAEKKLGSLAEEKAYERLLLDAVSVTYRAYCERLARRNLLDFGDLILHTRRLAENEPQVRNRFEYILVDEFQDTDSAQYKLLETLSKDLANVTVVCDRKQSIYEWREARSENIADFPGEPVVLDENYRSFEEILDSANFFIKETMPLEEPLRPALEGGRGRAGEPCVKLFRAEGREEEAEYVAREIVRLITTEGRQPREIVILMRSVRASRPFEDALAARGIPFATVGGSGFYDLRETKDLLSLMRLIANPFDDLSIVRVLQSAAVGLSDATLQELSRGRDSATSSIYETLVRLDGFFDKLEPRVGRRLQSLIEAIAELANRKCSLTTGELVSEMLDRTDYLKYLASIEGPRGSRFSNVSMFYKTASHFEERHPGASLEEFLSYMETTISGNATPATDLRPDAVQIMTVHQAKGLEFPIVFIVNLQKGAFPLKFRSDSFEHDEKFGLYARKMPEGDRLVRYEGGYGVSIEATLREKRYHEENRLMYVAVTRAERLLYLTSPSSQDDEDFFCRMEEFATGEGSRSAEMVDAFPEPEIPLAPKAGADAAMGVEQIRLAATEAVGRIERPLAPAEPTKQIEITALSYSRLALFRQCPAKYALRYIYNLPLSAHEESLEERHLHVDALALGDLLHRTLLQYHRRKRAGASADALKIFQGLSTSCSPQTANAGREMLENYLDSPLSRMETLYEEKEFHWRIRADSLQIMFEGKVDRMHRQGDAIKIVDYKTGAPHEEEHRLQLGIYRLAMEAVLGEKKILTSNFYLSTGEEVEQNFSPDDLREIQDGIIEDGRAIAVGNFDPHADSRRAILSCDECGYGAFCRRRQEGLPG